MSGQNSTQNLVQELKERIQIERKFYGKQYYMSLLKDIEAKPILSIKTFLKTITIFTVVLEIIPSISGFF